MGIVTKYFSRTLLFAASVFLSFFCFKVDIATATTYTVCASGCSFTTLTLMAASTTVNVGDTVQVQATYASTTETFPVDLTKGVTLDCQASGAIIGYSSSTSLTLNLIASTTLQNCTLNNINLTSQTNANAVTIQNNLKYTSNSTTITFESSMQNLLINSNTFSGITIGATGATISSTTVSNNTISPTSADLSGLTLAGTISNVTITSNTFSFGVPAVPGEQNYIGIVLRGNTITFASNTMSFSAAPQRLSSVIYIENAQTITVRGNYTTAPTNNATTIYGVGVYASTTASFITVTNNTFKCVNTSPCYGLYIDDNSTNTTLSVTSTYNLAFYPNSTSTSVYGAYIAKNVTSSTLNFYNDYNGIYNFTASVSNANGNSSFTAGSNSQTLNPFFMTDNASSADDNNLAPFSPYLDINGTSDVGAYSGSRRATITVTPGGTIDYSTIDATSTASVAEAFRSSDTVTLSAGTHTAFVVSSTLAATGITINGAGTSTLINATGATNAILLNQVSNSTISNLVMQNASSTINAYTATKMLFKKSGVAYDNSAGLGAAASSTLIFGAASCNNLTDVQVSADGTSISTVVNNTTGDFHLALLNVGGAGNAKITVLVPNSFFSTPAALVAEGGCSGYSVTVVQWVTSTFSRSGSTLTYNSSAVADAGVSLTHYSTSPPVITLTQTMNAGLKIRNGSTNSILSVTSTNNGYAVWFSGTTTANVVSSSIFSGSGSYDVYSDSNGTNNLKNTSFVLASSSFSGNGVVNVYYRVRALAQSSSNVALNGVAVTVTSADSSQTSTLTSGSDGYTSFSDNLLAHTMSSSSAALTTGGYNPYAFAAAAIAGYRAGSASENLSSKNQTVTISMSAAGGDVVSPALSGGGGGGSTSVAATTTIPVVTTTPIASPTSTKTGVPTSTPLTTVIPSIPQPTVGTAPIVPQVKPFTFTKKLEIGSYGQDVAYLVAFLKQNKVLVKTDLDRYFGPNTVKALQAFQKKNKLSATGKLDTKTVALINKKIAAAPLIPPSSAKPHIFKKNILPGQTSNEVRQLQLRLFDLGYFNYPWLTGYYGASTKAAVVAFQKNAGLKPTGRVQKETLRILNK